MAIFQEFLAHNIQITKEIYKNVKTLSDLDQNFANENEKLNTLRKFFLGSLNRNLHKSYPQNLEKEHDKCVAICETKMDLANEAYYLIDSNIKKVNQIIESVEQELINTKFKDFSYQNSLLDKNFSELVNFETYLINKKKSGSKKSRNAFKSFNLNMIGKKKLKKKVKLVKKTEIKIIKKQKEKNRFTLGNNLEDITHKEIDGKVGLREPIYCFCNYVSYGDMVKCDNPKCPREWFHFNCVGLSHLPKGKWYCSTKCAKLNLKT